MNKSISAIMEIERVERDIIESLDKGILVIIESGAANDRILSYSIYRYKKHHWQNYEEQEITFKTSGCIFPVEVQLADFDDVSTMMFNDALFVQVH